MTTLTNLSVQEFLFKCSKKYDLKIDGEVRPFKAIQFSKSSMSVYIPVIKDDTIYNYMLITYKNGKFHFDGIEMVDKETQETVKVETLDFTDKENFHMHLDPQLVEGAMNIFNTYSSLKCMRATLYPNNKNLTWVGSNNDYSKEYCVIAKCEYKPLGPKASLDLMMKIANKNVSNLTEMQKRTLELVQKYPETLQKTYEVTKDTDIAQNIFTSASILYLYRLSCMLAKDLEFPVIISPFLWIVKENEQYDKSTVF